MLRRAQFVSSSLLGVELFDLEPGVEDELFGHRIGDYGRDQGRIGLVFSEELIPVFGCSSVVDGVASRFAGFGAGAGEFAFVGGLLIDEFVDAGAEDVARAALPGRSSIESLPVGGEFGAGGL